MKNLVSLLIVAVLCLFITESHASGKLSIEPVYKFNDKKVEGKIGFSVWENLGGPVALNLWLGTGRSYDHGAYETWLTTKAGFDFALPARITLGVAGAVECNWTDKKCGPAASMKVSYTFWN